MHNHTYLSQGVAESCLAIFLPALVMGNFMVLNLFLALLLNSFNCEELKSRKEVRLTFFLFLDPLSQRPLCYLLFSIFAVSYMTAISTTDKG